MSMKKIPGFDNYFADNLGNIYSTKRGAIKLMSKFKIGKGYHAVTLVNNTGKYSPYLVHRLIAITFIENENKKRTVNHINGKKTDNRVSNLEWATDSENHLHAYKKLGRVNNKPNQGKYYGESHNTKPVLMLSKSGEVLMRFDTIKRASEHIGKNRMGISQVIDKPNRTCGGYLWRSDNG